MRARRKIVMVVTAMMMLAVALSFLPMNRIGVRAQETQTVESAENGTIEITDEAVPMDADGTQENQATTSESEDGGSSILLILGGIMILIIIVVVVVVASVAGSTIVIDKM